MKPQFQIGDRVLYRGDFGRAPAREGVIVGNDGEKNDQIVYDVEMTLPDGTVDGRWGYVHQFTLIRKAGQ